MKSIIFYFLFIFNFRNFVYGSNVSTIAQVGNVLHQLSLLSCYDEKESSEMLYQDDNSGDHNRIFYHKDSFDYSIDHILDHFFDEDDPFEIKVTPHIRYNLLTNEVRFDEGYGLTFDLFKYVPFIYQNEIVNGRLYAHDKKSFLNLSSIYKMFQFMNVTIKMKIKMKFKIKIKVKNGIRFIVKIELVLKFVIIIQFFIQVKLSYKKKLGLKYNNDNECKSIAF